MKLGEMDVDLVFDWVFRMIAPVRFINEQMTKREPIEALVARVWSFPIGLMLFVDIAATAFAGLNVTEKGIVAAAMTLADSLQLIVAPLVAWSLLKLARAPTDLDTVVIAFTPTILFAPVFQTMAIGTFIGQYHIAQMLITNSDSLHSAFEYAIHNLPKLNALLPQPIPIISPVVATIAGTGSLLLSVIACETIAWFGRHERLRVYIAVCCGCALADIPQQVFHLAQVALTTKVAALPGK